MHCTHTFPSTITPITQLSPFTHQLWLPHHTCTSFSHSHKSSTQTLTQCEVLFSPGYISERSPIHPAIAVFHPGLPDLGSLNLCLCPRLLPGIVYVSALPLIFLFLPADLACLILPIKYCCKWIHSPLTIPYTATPIQTERSDEGVQNRTQNNLLLLNCYVFWCTNLDNIISRLHITVQIKTKAVHDPFKITTFSWQLRKC